MTMMNEADRKFARLLMELTPTEISRTLGITRSTVYERMHRLRNHLTAAGLGPEREIPGRPAKHRGLAEVAVAG